MSDRSIRVFISSPSDVRPERLLAERVVNRLAREFSDHFQLEPLLWEREPLVANKLFQDPANIPRAANCDIVVVILWSRVGVPLPAEQFRGAVSGRAPVTGTEWEFEDALAAARAHGRPCLLFYRKDTPPRQVLDLDDAAAVQEHLNQRRAAEDFVARWFASDGGGFAHHRFADSAAFEDMLETHLRAQLRQLLSSGAAADAVAAPRIRWHQGSPFRGLRCFEPEHAAVFCGRGRARLELRERLTQQAAAGCAFVAVVGASGAGKSSLVRAGLIPDLMLPGMVGNVALCRLATMRPGDRRGDPLGALAGAILAGLPELSTLLYDAARLASLLATTPAQAVFAVEQGLHAAARAANPPLTGAGEARLIVLVDQLEELFTDQARDPRVLVGFTAALQALAESGLTWVIATLRSDYVDRLESVPALARLCDGAARHLVLPPDRGELGQIISVPAHQAGLRFETDLAAGVALDDMLLNAAAGRPGSLPLLEFTLEQLWQGRTDAGLLTLAAYRELGGLEGAIGRRASEVLAGLPDEVRAEVPAVLRALVTVPPGGLGGAAARDAPLATFPPGSARRALVEAFLAPDARLLVTDDSGTSVRVAHEALLTHWPVARDLVAAERGDLELRSRLEQAAARWRTADPADRDSLLLHAGLPLSEALDFVARRGDGLDQALLDYVARSEAAEAAEQARRREAERRRIESEQAAEIERLARAAEVQRLQAEASARLASRTRFAAGGLALLLVAAVGLAVYAVRAGFIAAHDRDRAERSEAASRQAVNGLVFTLAHGLRGRVGMPVDLVKNLLEQADGVIAGLRRDAPDDADLQALESAALGEFVTTYLDQGDTGRALQMAQRAVALDRALVARAPDNVAAQRGLADHLYDSGHVLYRQTKLADALAAYRLALAAAQNLVDRQPKNAEWRRMVAKVQQEIGNVLFEQHQYPTALAAFQAALAINRALAAADPNDTAALEGQMSNETSVGDMQWYMGSPESSAAAYQAFETIAKGLVARDPGNRAWQKGLALAQGRNGDAQQALGNLGGAVAGHLEAERTLQRLAALDPDDTGLQELLALETYWVGHGRYYLGDLAAAEADGQTVVKVQRALVSRDPANGRWQFVLWQGLVLLGDVQTARGELDAAMASYTQAAATARWMGDHDGDPGRMQIALYYAPYSFGRVQEARGEVRGATDSFRASLDLAERGLRENPGDSDWQECIVAAEAHLAAMRLRAGDTADARQHLARVQKLIAGLKDLIKGDPEFAQDAAYVQALGQRLR
jgi:tetratricopeptide (TPR) repeat protein